MVLGENQHPAVRDGEFDRLELPSVRLLHDEPEVEDALFEEHRDERRVPALDAAEKLGGRFLEEPHGFRDELHGARLGHPEGERAAHRFVQIAEFRLDLVVELQEFLRALLEAASFVRKFDREALAAKELRVKPFL